MAGTRDPGVGTGKFQYINSAISSYHVIMVGNHGLVKVSGPLSYLISSFIFRTDTSYRLWRCGDPS